MRLKTLLFLSLCLLPFIISAQIFKGLTGNNTDSLQKILPDLEGTERIDALNNIALASFSKYPDSSKKIALNTLDASTEINYQKGMADGYFNLGNAYYIQDSIKQAVTNFLKAEGFYKNLPSCNNQARLFYVLSAIYYDAGRNEDSRYYSKKIVAIYNDLSDEFNEIAALNYLACGYWYFDWDSAYYYHERALEILKTHPYRIGSSWTNFLLSMAAYSKAGIAGRDGEYVLRSRYYRQGLKYAITSLDFFHKSEATWLDSIYLLPAIYVHNHKGLLETGDKDSMQLALDYLDKIIYMSDTGNTLSPEYTLLAYNNHARRTRKSNMEKALQLYEKSIAEAEKQFEEFQPSKYLEYDPYFILTLMSEYRIRLAQTLNYVYRKFQQNGHFEKALKYYRLYNEASDEVYKKDYDKIISILEAELNKEQTNNRINSLEKEKELSDLRASQSRNLNIGIGVIFLILLLLGILFIRQNKLKSEHKSTMLEQKLLRLQMNPHFIFNALSNIMHAIEEDSKQSALSYLSKFSKLLRTNLESSRQDYILLEDEIKSITHYLELQQLRYEDKFNYAIETGDDIDLENAIIPPMLIQPFIENAIEHGIRHKEEKGHITIRFTRKGEKISCEMEDNGVGREKAWEAELKHKEHTSMATDIIRDRMAVLNKKLKQKISLSIIDLKSDADEALGTLVRLDLPYLLD